MRTRNMFRAAWMGATVAFAMCLAACTGEVGDDGAGEGSSSDAIIAARGPNRDTTAAQRGQRENVRSTTSALRDETSEPNPDPYASISATDGHEPNPDPYDQGKHTNESK
jgi:hypothetical protein